ncbi:hypothetical protein [Gelria sp. Kuro-4]|uniref:hypothetical protein n=1 Tax=Gelria sp. Kuro-4 TaxID=2796927 RepID=UPI001BEF1F52|nr:hypothetical protein [Gelria sp. Kuro-4]BCV25235.1 hypothetical protein kuro4_20080 [Gelria sp. Kuro-4]
MAIKLQRAAARQAEIRIFVVYEGKEDVGTKKKPRRVLKEKHQVAGLVSGKVIWAEASAAFGEVWDSIVARRMKRRGARWGLKGGDYESRLLTLQEEGAFENLLKHTRPLDTERITNLTQRMTDRN